MIRPDPRRLASIAFFSGATRTGKTASMKQRLAKLGVRPVMIFDPKHELAPELAETDERRFLANVGRFSNGGTIAALWPDFDDEKRVRQFNRFCRTAMNVARTLGRVAVVADELHTVTQANRAPPGWRELVTMGCSYGAHILCASQRPASIDKDMWSNMSYVRTFRLNYDDDGATLGKTLRVPADEIIGLGQLEYIERDLQRGTPAKRGKLTFDNGTRSAG